MSAKGSKRTLAKNQWERKGSNRSQQLPSIEVKVWLEDLGLAHYSGQYDAAGYLSFRAIQHMNPSQRAIMTTKVGMPPVDAEKVFEYFLERDQNLFTSPKNSAKKTPGRSIEMTGRGRALSRQNSLPAPNPEASGWMQRVRRASLSAQGALQRIPRRAPTHEIARKPSSFWVGWKQHGQRFLDRDERGNQSKGNANVTISSPNKAMLTKDYVHTLLEMRTWKLIVVMCAVYCFCFCAYAPFYWWASDACDLEIDSYSDAFYLSMETMVTIGYGVPDQYYNECVSGIFIVTSQSLLGRVLDAVLMVRRRGLKMALRCAKEGPSDCPPAALLLPTRPAHPARPAARPAARPRRRPTGPLLLAHLPRLQAHHLHHLHRESLHAYEGGPLALHVPGATV
jgi:hypothetical protein